MVRFAFGAFAAACLLTLPAAAQVSEIVVGAPVKDMAGRDVGLVVAVDQETATVKTDRHEVRLPLRSVAAHKGSVLIAISRDELNAEVDRLASATQAPDGAAVAVSGAGQVVAEAAPR